MSRRQKPYWLDKDSKSEEFEKWKEERRKNELTRR